MSLSPRLLVVALLLLVVPAGVTALFLSSQSRSAAADGAQPGGMIGGRLVPIAGSPADARLGGLDVELVAIAPDGVARTLVRAAADEDGRFLIEAPAIVGHYELRAGGGAWQPAAQPFSLLRGPPSGETTVHLRPAARLALSFVRRSGLAVRGGQWQLDGAAGSGWLPAFGGTRIERSGKFSGAAFEIDGLPPIRGRLRIDLGGGERVEIVLNLAVGENRHTVEL